MGLEHNPEDDVGAEFAFCKLLNVFPDLTTNIRSGGEDCSYFKETIDVKRCTGSGRRLYVRSTKVNHPCDLYAFMVGVIPKFFYLGYVTKGTMFNKIDYDKMQDPYYVLREELIKELPTIWI